MRGGWVVLLVMGGLVVSGCVGEPATDAKPLRDIYGRDALVAVEGDLTLIGVPALEAVLLEPGGSATWQDQINRTFEPPTIVLSKSEPGPQGGGGVVQNLTAESMNLSLTVRFKNGSDLEGYQARWLVQQDASDVVGAEGIEWSAPRSARAGFTVPVTGPGAWVVVAELLLDGRSAAITGVPFILALSAHWVVESSVHPVGGSQMGQTPPNYDEMADEFPIEIGPAPVRLVLETTYRGTWSAPSGVDVDLELRSPSDACEVNSGSGGTDPPAQQPEDFSFESIDTTVGRGNWTIRVGALSTDCTDTYYSNSANVPYTLDVRLLYGPPAN